jgi:hypothetical protein
VTGEKCIPTIVGWAQTKVRATLPLINDDQPGAAIAAIYAKLRCESQLGARRAMKRVDIPAVRIIPKMIFDQNFDSDLSLRHADYYK